MADYSNRKWVIVLYADVTDQMIDDCMQPHRDVLRHTTSGEDRVILKYEGSKPYSLYGIQTYTHNQIKNILNDEDGDWV